MLKKEFKLPKSCTLKMERCVYYAVVRTFLFPDSCFTLHMQLFTYNEILKQYWEMKISLTKLNVPGNIGIEK